MGDVKPRIYLHIGRNKAGSTSLQDFFLAKRDQLAATGLQYFLFGHLKDSVSGVPGFASHIDLAAYADSRPEHACLISNEFMFGWPRASMKDMASCLAKFEAQIIVYLRPYSAWVFSNYAEGVKQGTIRRDFDIYLDKLRPRIPAWRYLKSWGDAVGWDRVRIRSLDPRDLVGGDLVIDCLSALGLDSALAAGAPHSNRKLHWAVLEMLRALVETDNNEGWNEVERRVVEPLHALMEQCLTYHSIPEAAYLTVAQAHWLADLYNRDIARIAERTGIVLQPELPSGNEREMLPSIDYIPDPLFHDWITRAAAADFRATHPDAARAAARLAAARADVSGRIG